MSMFLIYILPFLKVEKWSRSASNFIALIWSYLIRKMLAIFFWSWILKDCIEVQEKKKKFFCILQTL